MGKGGYIGGGTIIGPHTPDWFGQRDEPEPEEQEAAIEPDGQPQPKIDKPKGKLTRNQRRKIAKARNAAKEARTKARRPPPVAKKTLTTAAEQRIAKLRIHIRGLEKQIASCEQALRSSRIELDGVLKEYGLPLDGPNNNQGN